MLLGSLMSLFAATWKYMTKDSAAPERHALSRLAALNEQVNKAQSEAELAQIEQQVDDILKAELDRYARGAAETTEAAALSLATHRLEHLTNQRRTALAGRSPVGAAS